MKQLLSLLTALLLTLPLHAQLQHYRFTHEAGLFTELKDYNVPVTAHIVADDTIGPEKVDLPFAFRFGNTAVDSLGISENGFVWFGAAPGNSFFFPPFSGSLPPDVDGVIVAMGTDLHPHTFSGLTTKVNSAVVGSAPFRMFIVEWLHTSRIEPLQLASSEDTFSFQIKLYETTNRIELVYGDFRLHESASTFPKIGLRGPQAGNYSLRMGNWQSTVAGSMSGFLTLDRISKPQFGQLFVWEPPATTGVPRPEVTAAVPVFPVPASDVLRIGGGQWEATSYTVYDVAGRKWSEGTVRQNAIPVAGLAAGSYVLMLKDTRQVSRAIFTKR